MSSSQCYWLLFCNCLQLLEVQENFEKGGGGIFNKMLQRLQIIFGIQYGDNSGSLCYKALQSGTYHIVGELYDL